MFPVYCDVVAENNASFSPIKTLTFLRLKDQETEFPACLNVLSMPTVGDLNPSLEMVRKWNTSD